MVARNNLIAKMNFLQNLLNYSKEHQIWITNQKDLSIFKKKTLNQGLQPVITVTIIERNRPCFS